MDHWGEKMQDTRSLPGGRKRLRINKSHVEIYLLFLPVLVWYILFCYAPMGGVVIAFKDYKILKGIGASKWVGMENFRYLFSLPSFRQAVVNTVVMGLQSVCFSFPLPILFALLLNEVQAPRFKKVVQTVSYLPHFISWSVAGGLVYMLLSPNTGALNNLLRLLGGQGQNYVGISAYFHRIVLVSHMWKHLGWSSIVFLAAITGVDEQLYEAAYMDGAGRLKRIWHVTLPGIRSTIAVMLILEVGNILSVSFNQIYSLINDAVLDKGETLDYFVYRMGLSSANNFSVATAVGLIKSLVGLVMIVGTNVITKKLTDGEGGIW